MKNLSQERKAEIAVSLLEYLAKKKFKSQFESFNRDLGNIAKESGVPAEELKSFLKPIAQSAVDEAFK
jgi:hypothetical protein